MEASTMERKNRPIPNPQAVLDSVREAGKRIRSLREARGWDQIDLVAAARKVGGNFVEVTLSHWEAGTRLPNIVNLTVLALALGVTPNEIVGFPDTEPGN